VIVVQASTGLVIELGVGESGRWDTLAVRLAPGLAGAPFRFEASEGPGGRLLVRPLEPREPGELLAVLSVLLRYENAILAEVRKYRS
jgi:hypothetical protein